MSWFFFHSTTYRGKLLISVSREQKTTCKWRMSPTPRKGAVILIRAALPAVAGTWRRNSARNIIQATYHLPALSPRHGSFIPPPSDIFKQLLQDSAPVTQPVHFHLPCGRRLVPQAEMHLPIPWGTHPTKDSATPGCLSPGMSECLWLGEAAGRLRTGLTFVSQ